VAKSRPNSIDPKLLDQLLAGGHDKERIFGQDGLLKQLTAALVQRALQAELAGHLGYDHYEPVPPDKKNTRNGTSPKTLITESGPLELQLPRDRDGTFEPQLVKKHQRRVEGFDDKVISLCARGMTVRDIQGHLQELYGTEVSPDLISRVTDAVTEDVVAWQNRPLEPVWPILYLDALVVRIRDGGSLKTKAIHAALGVNMEGKKEVLALWIAENEGAKFWLSVVTELKNRGVRDVLIACCDGLKGFPEAIHAVFPETTVQTCIVHMIRNSLRYVNQEEQRAVIVDLRPVYQATTEAEALEALDRFGKNWDKKYPSITRTWLENWEKVKPFFAFEADIRRAIYTTNAIESLNRQLRKALKVRGQFPNDQAALKVVYLALDRASKKWTMPIKKWGQTLQQFAIYFPGRVIL
jgi:putative transposase